MIWTALPSGADVPLSGGKSYAVVASVSSSTTRAKIDSALTKYFPGVTITTYVEQGESGGPPADPDTSRKQVAAVVFDKSFSGSLSWSKGIPIVAPDIYTLSEAWVWTGEGVPSDSPPWAGAIPVRRSTGLLSLTLWGVGILAVASVGVAVYHWRQPIRKVFAHAGS